MKYLLWILLLFPAITSFASDHKGANKNTKKNADKGTHKKIVPTRKLAYKKTEQAKLNLHIFEPSNHLAKHKKTAVVFFFGGGWNGGDPVQYYQISERMAKLGIVAICVEYRTAKRHKTTPFDCVEDGKSAIRYVREHAAELGIDPERIVAGGGSAGGHVAACTDLIDGLDHSEEDAAVSSRPNALILFNPVLDTTEKGYGLAKVGKDRKTDISPVHHVKTKCAPTLLFHGTADTTVPFENAERFTQLMTKAGNDCTLIPYKGKGHGFFHGSYFRRKNDNKIFDKTYQESLEFLRKIEFLPQ